MTYCFVWQTGPWTIGHIKIQLARSPQMPSKEAGVGRNTGHADDSRRFLELQMQKIAARGAAWIFLQHLTVAKSESDGTAKCAED